VPRGRYKTTGTIVTQMETRPILLKRLAVDCDITQGEIAEATGLARSSINSVFNKGYIPSSIPDFRENVERVVRNSAKAGAWLLGHGLTMADIWLPAGEALKGKHPAGMVRRQQEGQRRQAIIPGDPDIITIQWEVEMITDEARRHFKLFRNPFIDDIQKDTDIYMSEEHRYIEAAMVDAAKHGGFLAVIGEVGSGKSVMRRKVVETLKRDGDTLVIYPQMIDKGRLTAGSICDAIIQDVSSERCKAKLEDKTRQVQRLLLDRSKSGYRAVLVIEEAHDLNAQTLKYLKRFYELEDGYRKLLGIVLIGQTELKHMFNEAQNVDMREVIRRVQVAEIKGLNGHLPDYLGLKFKRVGVKVEDLFTEAAFEALSRRLTSTGRDGKSKVSHAYPLLVNNYTARALNLAQEMGETRITAEVIEAI
jgi:type II secretory pathway predicted ATPase ExeA